ncbi:MAG: hypothetical protein Q4E88_04005 [Coriobacteriia bacterium]|nr:hypothetical protein [Coriobacteriia bacterium]
MNPLIVIPVFISSRQKKEGDSIVTTYDHTTSMSQPGELPRLLDSLKKVDYVTHVVVLVVAEKTIVEPAAVKIERLTMQYKEFSTMVIGADELSAIHKRAQELGVPSITKEVALTSYGAIRNVGLTVAQIFGFDSVIFLDDDEVVEDPNFMTNAVYGLGKLTKSGVPIIAKTGYYLNSKGSYLSRHKTYWHDRLWQKGRAFNQWISKAIKGPRLSRSNHVCGGCMALHRQAFMRLAFDPWVVRGEDLDYMLNLRMYGSDIWFDNQLVVKHLPPEILSEGVRFRQDIFRWLYEFRKLEYSRTQIDLLQLKASDMKPYPGPFLEPGIEKRILWTARFRSFGRPDKKEYRNAAWAAAGEANIYAQRNCQNYFEFMRIWPEFMKRIDKDKDLQNKLEMAGHNRRRAAYKEMEAENDLEAAKAAMEKNKKARGSVNPGSTGEIQLNVLE